MAAPTVIYERENWSPLKRHSTRPERVEIENFRFTAGYTSYYHKTNEKIG